MLALFPFLVTDWNTWALATYSLGVAADLCFFTKVCPAVSVSVSSATAPRRGSPPHPCLAPSRRSRTGTPGPWPPTAWVWPRTSASSPRSVQQSPCQSHPPPRRGEAVRRVLVWLQAGGHGLGHLGPGRSVELGLARILGAGGGPEQGGQRSHRPPRHLGSAIGGQLRLLVDAGHAGDW